MRKIEVLYSGGESRYGQNGCDFMMAEVSSSDGEMIELFAERDPADYVDEETAEAMRADHIDVDSLYEKYPDLETAAYDDLKADILAQAREKGIDPSLLHFWFDKE